jgi:SHS2 domain-containing protein
MKEKTIEFLPHTADIKFRTRGATIEEAFIASAMAVKQTLTQSNVQPVIKKTLGIIGDDEESLLYNFLEEIIFLLDSENFIIARVENLYISKDDNNWTLRCEFLGDNTSGKEESGKPYQFDEHIKGITYHEMKIKNENGEVIIEVVLDV